MIRLLLKIFLAYWIAAGIVIFISDFEPHMHIHNPELTDALDKMLALHGRELAEAYETGHCAEAQALLTNSHDGLYLSMPDGHMVCGDPHLSQAAQAIVRAAKKNVRIVSNYEWLQLIAVPVTSSRGSRYVVLFKNGFTSVLHLYGLLPGATTVAISCVVTMFLALLLALPIRRLRQAAGGIATGRLDSRVKWGSRPAGRYGSRGGDDIDQLVRDFNHMAEKLQTLANAQRLLLRDVSHELRSPLTRLGVGLSLARSESPASMREHLDRIGTEASRLNDLIGQILSLSRMDSVHESNLSEVISVSEMVVDLLPDVQYEAMQSNCSIQTAICPECRVRGDAELLRTAIENIVRNAIKYVPSEGEIRVETGNDEIAGERFSTVTVSDNGPGIPEHELEAVLEPFYRADRLRHRQQDGSGIGLAIADRAVKLHGGTIAIRNKPDGGLMVKMSFPCAGASLRNS